MRGYREEILVPLPMESFINSTCELANPLQIFAAVYSLSNRLPCKGCGYDGHGQKCKAKTELFRSVIPATPLHAPQETVRETAARLNISISEVRRRRKGKS